MSEKKAGMSKQQPVHLKINLRATLSLQLPHWSTLLLLLPNLKGERTELRFTASKAYTTPAKHENAQREKIHNLYGYIAAAEFLKGRSRTPGGDCRSGNNWDTGLLQSPWVQQDKDWPYQRKQKEQKDPTVQTLLIY